MTAFADQLTELFRSPEHTEEHLECLRGDFTDLGAEETLRQAVEAEQMLQGFMAATEDINIPCTLLWAGPTRSLWRRGYGWRLTPGLTVGGSHRL